jgi:hypothetical protein
MTACGEGSKLPIYYLHFRNNRTISIGSEKTTISPEGYIKLLALTGKKGGLALQYNY